MVGNNYGTVTFMPKPIKTDNGTGYHPHSIWRQAALRRQRHAGLSEMCLYFIGGVIKHARAERDHQPDHQQLQAPSVPGYEAPVCSLIRAATAPPHRIPMAPARKAKRACALPDPLANPYLAYSAC